MKNWGKWLGWLAFVGGISALLPTASAQQTIGLFQNQPGSFDGYTLLAPLGSSETFLIDNCGREVHRWSSSFQPAMEAKLLENGLLLRTCEIENPKFHAGGGGGRIELLDWDSNITWWYEYSSDSVRQHHDAIALPNGNIMFIAWQYKSRSACLAAGRDTAYVADSLWEETLIEVQPTQPGQGNIVWEWHIWDHLAQDVAPAAANYMPLSNHPERVDINFYNSSAGPTGFADFLHFNGLDYNAARDEVMVSVHNYSEVYILDHSTTTAQAAGSTGGNRGKGGDLLYRWGNPRVYDRASLQAQQQLYWQHNAHWIPDGFPDAGKVMVFNNGNYRPQGNYSTVDIFSLPIEPDGSYTLNGNAAYGPQFADWQYAFNPPSSVYSSFISGAERMPNGNTLICRGPEGLVMEIDQQEQEVWRYVNPVATVGILEQGQIDNNKLFRAHRYAPNYAGLAGRNLSPGDPIELNPLPLPIACTQTANNPSNSALHDIRCQNPFSEGLEIVSNQGRLPAFEVLDIHGKSYFVSSKSGSTCRISSAHWPSGLYILKLEDGSTLKLMKL